MSKLSVNLGCLPKALAGIALKDDPQWWKGYVRVHRVKDEIGMTATDGHVLAHVSIPALNGEKPNALVPREILAQVRSGDYLAIDETSAHVIPTLRTGELANGTARAMGEVRVIGANGGPVFPERCDEVVPKGSRHVVRVNPSKLMQVLRAFEDAGHVDLFVLPAGWPTLNALAFTGRIPYKAADAGSVAQEGHADVLALVMPIRVDEKSTVVRPESTCFKSLGKGGAS